MDVHEKNETGCWEPKRHRKVIWKKVPLGAWLLSYLGVFNCYSSKRYEEKYSYDTGNPSCNKK